MKKLFLAVMMSVFFATFFAGCKGQQQMQQQVGEMDTKVAETQRRLTSMEGELKKANFEITQMKSLITKLGEVVVTLQKSEEERQKKQAELEAASKAAAAKRAGGPSAAKKKVRKK